VGSVWLTGTGWVVAGDLEQAEAKSKIDANIIYFFINQ
jgi:hypothetical protein